MSETQYYALIALPFILMNSGLFIYLGSQIDKVIDKLNEVDSRVAVLEDRDKRVV